MSTIFRENPIKKAIINSVEGGRGGEEKEPAQLTKEVEGRL